MNLETFFEKFDLFADCPNAVQKMRELILELAVQGKLVEHGSDDWRAIVLGDVIELISGQHLLAHEHNDQGKGIPYLTGPSDFGEYYPVPKRWTEFPKVIAEPGDILITVKGAGVGKTNFLKEHKTAISRQLMAIRVVGADADYVHLVLKKAASHFQATMVGIAIPGIGRKDVLSLELALPPLAEQKRIVAKVDEMMALCDALETQQKERETKRTALAKASLAAFAEAPSPQSLELLFHPSYAIDPADLRKSILTLAVQGKLVEQREEEGGAEELLARIVSDRDRQKSSNSRRAGKALSPIQISDIEFILPDSWMWVRLGEVARLWNGFAFSSHDFIAEGIPVIRIGDLRGGVVDLSSCVCVPESVADAVSQDAWIPEGALLIAMSGATTGKIAFNRTGRRLLLNQRVGRIDPSLLESGFVCLFFETIIQRNLAISSGSAIPNLSSQQINETPFPLPPLAEQKRIVAKVDELMALVDRLETKEKAARETASRLLEAMVAELSGRAAA